MTSLKELDIQPRNTDLNDILDDLKSGKKIYDEETEREVENLEKEILSEKHQMQRTQIMPQEMPQIMYTEPPRRYESYHEEEKNTEKSIFTKIFSFIKIFILTYFIVAIFNSSLTLNIIESNFSWMLFEYDTHSWLSTFIRTFMTTIILMISYLLF